MVHISLYKILFLVVLIVIEHRHTNKYIVTKGGRYMKGTTVQLVNRGESRWQGAVKLGFSEDVRGVYTSSAWELQAKKTLAWCCCLTFRVYLKLFHSSLL